MNEDYKLPSSNTNFTLSEEPVTVTVILQDDGVPCEEGLETIFLTIVPVVMPVENIILEHRTVVINLKDNCGRAICLQIQPISRG